MMHHVTMMWCMQKITFVLLFWLQVLSKGYAAAVVSDTPYSTYVLEDICNGEEAVIPVHLQAWSAAIVTLGQGGDGEYYDRNKHTCTLKVTTEQGFHLGGVVESIRIQGMQHPATKRWECEDYIVFRTKKAGLVNQLLDMVLPDKLFKGRQSEKLCGERSLDTTKIFRMIDTSSHSNVFSTMANSLELEYHQNQELRTPVNNSFTVVISTFKNINEHVFTLECGGSDGDRADRTLCGGGGSPASLRGERLYCVHARYVCDGHVNCALPGGGTDERGCPGGEVAGLSQYSVVFSSTIIIFIALGSVVGAATLLVVLYTLVARARGDSNRSSPADSTTAVNYTASSDSADIAPTSSRRSHRSRNRSNRSNRRHDSITEEDEEGYHTRRGGGGGGGGRSSRARREGGGESRGGAPRRPTPTLPADPVVQQHQHFEEKSQLPQEQPLMGVNQYNSFNRLNTHALNSHLSPSAPDIQPYPPSYDILFPTDG